MRCVGVQCCEASGRVASGRVASVLPLAQPFGSQASSTRVGWRSARGRGCDAHCLFSIVAAVRFRSQLQ